MINPFIFLYENKKHCLVLFFLNEHTPEKGNTLM